MPKIAVGDSVLLRAEVTRAEEDEITVKLYGYPVPITIRADNQAIERVDRMKPLKMPRLRDRPD